MVLPVLERRGVIAMALATATAGLISPRAHAQRAALASWNDGKTKQSILDFVSRVTKADGPDFVPAAERIAVFDNDGTLWTERPFYFQLAFAFDRVRATAAAHPEWSARQPFKALIENDVATALKSGEKGLLEVMAVTHAGMKTEEFSKAALDWVMTAKHPRFNRPYVEIIYKPMQELLSYLRANEFKTFIVSGGGIEFMRPWVEKTYGIPPEQVVGSSGVVKFVLNSAGKSELLKEAKIEFVDDHAGKPVGINRFIGRRPIFAFGNSDGDHQMLQYTAGGSGLRFTGLVHHTDAEREYAYDRQSHIGKLDKALDEALLRNWTIVDMKQDWKTVFSFSG
jgi:phosphoserine phosphatase